MSDTYTATVPQEEHQEMSKVREIFDRALNALVEASSLAKTVEQLKTDLEGLKVQVTHYRNTISNQDDQITRLRQDRDAARTAQYQAEDNVRHMSQDLDNAKREADSLSQSNVRLNDRITEVTKERDEAQFKLLELQESHAALSKKFDEVYGQLEGIYNSFRPQPKTNSGELHTPVALPTQLEAAPLPEPQVSEPRYPETDVQWPQDINR